MATITPKRALNVLAAFSFVALVASPIAASAATDTANTTVEVDLGSVISLTTSGTVSISVTPSASGSMSSASDSVSVTTNNDSGYALTLSDGDTDTNLDNGNGDTIAAHGGTQASPTSLSNNEWGYRVDGVDGFGAGPTAAETNAASSSHSWAGVPSSASPNTLKTTSSAASGDATTVWYGVQVDQTLPTGTYSDTVTYTATTN